MDVPGQEKRAYLNKPICPISGPGSLTKPERLKRRKQIIAASGADTEEHCNKVEAFNHGVTFHKQAGWLLNHAQTRKRRPIKAATALEFTSYLNKWLNPNFGDWPLSTVNNLVVKGLVTTMTKAGVSPKMVGNVIQVVKMVVASAVNENGEAIHPRTWNHEFIDLPEVKDQWQPVHSSETRKAIAAGSAGREQLRYVLLGATGLRFGEAFGLEIDKHISDDFSTLHIRQKVGSGHVQPFLKTGNGVRDVDLHPSIAAMLKKVIGNRTSGFLFRSKKGFPLLQSNILRHSLHPLLESVGQPKSGAHEFRRFRATWLRKQRAPEDLIRFWFGHANKSVTELYCKLKEDVTFRKKVAEEIGIGFELPAAKPRVAPYRTHTEVLSHVA